MQSKVGKHQNIICWFRKQNQPICLKIVKLWICLRKLFYYFIVDIDLSSVEGIESRGLSSINCDYNLNKGWRKHRKAMSVLNQGGEDAVECPLCMEPLEVDDLNFFPCTCGYQICRFCWHRIRTDENGLCPACRKAYSENPADFKPLSKEEIARWIQFSFFSVTYFFSF